MSDPMMRAVITQIDGGLTTVTRSRPAPGPGEVLVRVMASGINPLDAKIRAGTAPHARHPLPAILGIDVAGTIEAVGVDVDGLAAGDEVYGMTGGVGGMQGSLAEYQVADAALLARKPANLTMREAAALPLVAITAWEGLVDRGGIQAGQSLLVMGGAGGVGHVAVQLARALGAEVSAVDEAAKAGFIASLGAAPVDRDSDIADYAAGREGGGFDLVFDTVGGAGLDASFQAVRQFGHVVSCLGWGTHNLAPLSFKGGSYSGVFTLEPLLSGKGRRRHGDILKRIAALCADGRLRPVLDDRIFQLDDVNEAYRLMSERLATGKLVVSLG
jgi:NADPH2:quinone reductase